MPSRLQDASELKSRFLSYMSHEFRTPLGSIRSIVAAPPGPDGRAADDGAGKQVGFIRSSAAELTEMVNDLLDLAKVEAAASRSRPPGSRWWTCSRRCAACSSRFSRSSSMSLIFEEPVGVPRSTPTTRSSRRSCATSSRTRFKFTQRRRGAGVGGDGVAARWSTFAVSDTGIGIPNEHLDALFQDFVQVDSPIQKRLRGTGLGLSLSRRLAVVLGGDVAVEVKSASARRSR